jgi:hypothetical protein
MDTITDVGLSMHTATSSVVLLVRPHGEVPQIGLGSYPPNQVIRREGSEWQSPTLAALQDPL